MNYLKTNFNTIAGWSSIIALITAVPLGFFFWWLGREAQEPIFYIGEQSVLIDQANAGRAPISVLDGNGEPVVGNVVLTKFYFWNNGKKPIEFDKDVIKSADTGKQEVFVSLIGDSSARILQNSCPVSVNRQYTGFKNELEQVGPTKLVFSFNVVKHLEGVTCQVVFEGSRQARLEMEGALLEVSQGLDSESSLARLQAHIVVYRLYGIGYFSIIPAVFFVSMAFILFGPISNFIDDDLPGKKGSSLSQSLKLLGFFLTTLIGISFAVAPFLEANEKPDSIYQSDGVIPGELKRKDFGTVAPGLAQ